VEDVPDKDGADGAEGDEDAQWRDLVARFDAPAATGESSPWPDREDTQAEAEAEADPAPVTLFQTETTTTGTPVVSSWRASTTPPPEQEEHFVPPPPPPLPRLEPLTKAAWAGLFGGPGYLLLGTALNWSIPGIAVFLAIAAFVAGVALLVLKLTDSDPPSEDDDDDGAIV
jgi:hypothetical protein